MQTSPVASIASKTACVASVSVGLSAGLKNFSLFERAKIGASAKNVALAPIFAPPKSEKCLERAGKPTETLATRAMSKKEHVPEKSGSIYLSF